MNIDEEEKQTLGYGSHLDKRDLMLSGYQICKERYTKIYFGPEWRDEQADADSLGVKLEKGLLDCNGKLLQAFKLIVAGKSNHEINKEIGRCRKTLKKQRYILTNLTKNKFLCKCGKDGQHPGSCKYRKGRPVVKPMEGRIFGRLTVGPIAYSKYFGRQVSHWYTCFCSCGNNTTVQKSNLNSGHVKSCGCLNRELQKKRWIKFRASKR